MKRNINSTEKEFLLYNRDYMAEEEQFESFSSYIRAKRKEVLIPNKKEGISIQEHAELLGLSQGMYQKIVNKQKPTQSRDCIIAMCVSLLLDVDQTNLALKLYSFMPGLDERCPRDQKIIEILNGETENEISIETVNNRLTRYGYAPLMIINHRKKNLKPKDTPEKPVFPYKILKKNVLSNTEEMYFGDPYDSLATAYDFSRYHCLGIMILLDPRDGSRYRLSASSDGSYSLMKKSEDGKTTLASFEKAKDSNEFADCFMELQGLANTELKKLEKCLNDTKNYRERIGAGIHEGRIHIYYETFNYYVPELNEYFLFEYIDGVYRLTVSNHSLYMQNYLSEEEYTEHYGALQKDKCEHYDSLDEIEALLISSNNSDTVYKLRLRKKVYKDLKLEVDKCLEDIRQKRIFVRSLKNIWEDPDRVCSFFKVEKEFHCKVDDEDGNRIIADVQSASIPTENGENIEITLQDLYRAFELGFISIKDICQVKQKTGSVESVLK